MTPTKVNPSPKKNGFNDDDSIELRKHFTKLKVTVEHLTNEVVFLKNELKPLKVISMS